MYYFVHLNFSVFLKDCQVEKFRFTYLNSAQKLLLSSPTEVRGTKKKLNFVDQCYLPNGQTINAKYYLFLLVQLKDILKENAAGRLPNGSYSCTTMPRLTGHFKTRRIWNTWVSSVLITHPILRTWPRLTTTCSLGWKNKWKITIFRPTRRSLLLRRPGSTDNHFFFEWLAKVRAAG
jgi:hypothetical protein